jgi:hypothetical protein
LPVYLVSFYFLWNMEPRPNDLKAIRILYIALLAGQILFALIVTILVETGMLSTGINSLTPVLQVAIILIAAVAIPASFFLFRKRLTEIDPEENLGKKLEKYRAALIIRMALCEFPVMFAIIIYFITHDRSFLWIVIVLISNFLFIFPSNSKITNSLQLNSSEQSSLGMDSP